MAGCEPALLPNENGPAGNLTFRPGQPPPDLTRSDHVDRTEQPDQQPSPAPVDTDATASAAELLDRAAVDYGTGWGCPDVRATDDGTGSAA